MKLKSQTFKGDRKGHSKVTEDALKASLTDWTRKFRKEITHAATGGKGELRRFKPTSTPRTRWQEALAPLRKAIRSDAQNAGAHHFLGTTLMALGRWEEAMTVLRQTISLEPDNAEAHYFLGLTLRARQRWEEAVAPLREVIRLEPESAEAHYFLGATLLERWEEATTVLRETIRLEPENARAHYFLGLTLRAVGRWEQAVAPLREATRLNPENPEAHYRLGAAFAGLERWEEAIAPLRAAIKLKPENADAQYRLGTALGALERWEEAAAVLLETTKLEPKNGDAHYRLGAAFAALERWEEAIAPFREAIRLEPQNADAHYRLGSALAVLERWEEASEPLRETTRSADAHHNLGAPYTRRGNLFYPPSDGIGKSDQRLNEDLAKTLDTLRNAEKTCLGDFLSRKSKPWEEWDGKQGVYLIEDPQTHHPIFVGNTTGGSREGALAERLWDHATGNTAPVKNLRAKRKTPALPGNYLRSYSVRILELNPKTLRDLVEAYCIHELKPEANITDDRRNVVAEDHLSLNAKSPNA